MSGRILIVSGVVFCCGFAWDRRQRGRDRDRRRASETDESTRRALEECLKDVWSEPRQLIADVQRETVGPAESAARPMDGRIAEVSLTPQAQRDAWASAKHMASEGMTEDRQQALRMLLQHNVAPLCDWSNGYAPYQHDPRFRDVYESTALILDLAELSLKYGDATPTDGNGAVVAPGWIHCQPAPSGVVRTGDNVEFMVDRFSASPDDGSRYAEWAWIRVDAAPGGAGVTGVVTYDAPPGAQANTLRNTESHGFGPGTPVTVPRRCIHRVVNGR